MSDATIGWGGEFWLSSDNTTGNLVEMVEVVSFGLPNDQADEVDVTHLKSPDRRKEYILGLKDGGEVQVSLNYVPGSATDIAIRDAKDGQDVRAVRFIVPDQSGDPAWQIDAFALVRGYERGPVAAGDKVAATITLRITGAQTEGAAS